MYTPPARPGMNPSAGPLTASSPPVHSGISSIFATAGVDGIQAFKSADSSKSNVSGESFTYDKFFYSPFLYQFAVLYFLSLVSNFKAIVPNTCILPILQILLT